jgi:hypothetical protein
LKMKTGKGARPNTPRWPLSSLTISALLFFSILFAAGCGAPGEPLPPAPPTPIAITDLEARQAGDAVQLSFTMPDKSTLGEKLKEAPTLEVLRGSFKPDGTVDEKSFRVVDTVPGSLVNEYVQKSKVEFPDAISPEELKSHAGETVLYRVRTYVSPKKISSSSSSVSLKLYPVPAPISSVQVELTENAIDLKWQPPTRTTAGEPLGAIPEYHVYRGELDPQTAEAAKLELRKGTWKAPFLQIAATTIPEYHDVGFDYGKGYAYTVRSVIQLQGMTLESSNSPLVVLTPRDTFPPAAPQGLVAAVLPGATGEAKVVDLSWSINLETDLAGYRVYRSEQEGTAGELLTKELLPTPAYRDTSVHNGQKYWYSVTAVDKAGNESAPSPPIAVEVAQPPS